MSEYLRDRRLKMLTNSYPLAEFLIRDSKCRVALPGGEVYREEEADRLPVRRRRDAALFRRSACS
jgi:DeoR/GlpR family transcriptional regulator of sugar metabolism